MAEQRIRIGVVGAGWWATENHIPVLQSRPEVEVTAVCRLGPAELERVRKRFEIPYASEDYRRLLDEVSLDGVVVASPHHLHFEHARAALERKLHVLCEKPMALRSADAWELERLAAEQRRHFLVPYGWNYNPMAVEARRLVESGALGAIRHVSCQMAGSTLDLFSGREPHFVEWAFQKPEAATWNDARHGGGFGHGQTTHLLGLVLWVGGLRPREVFAADGRSSTGVDVYQALTVRFDGGATAAVSGSAGVPNHLGYQVDVRIFGDDGMLLLDLEAERERLELRRRDRADHVREFPRGAGTYSCVEPVERFVDLITGRSTANHSTAELGARVVDLLDAAYRSAASGRPEKVP
jgi:predicted dehydrogenase